MEETCDTCCRWQKHFYHEHLDAKGKRFLEVMKGDFFSGMIIPREFTKQCMVELAGAVDLKGPGGYTWHVKVKLGKAGDYMFYGGDWKRFLLKNQVKRGDFLVFMYEGDSCFSVMMFDASGLEKIPPCFVKRSSLHRDSYQSNQTEKSEDGLHEVTSLGSSSNSASQVHLSTPEKCRDKNKRKKDAHETEHNIFCSKQLKKEVNKALEGDCATDKINWSSVFVSKRRPVTDAEITRTLQRAYEIRLVNPSFLIVMQPSHVYRRFFMTIAHKFAVKYIAPKKQTVILRLPKGKREWHVSYVIHTPSTSGIGGLAWMRFVYDNNLEEGDACVFELTRRSEALVMDVHIFRVVEEIVSFAVGRK